MKKKILTITICVLVLFSMFVLPVAAWGVSTPAQDPVKVGEVLSADFLAADEIKLLTYRQSPTQGSILTTLTPDYSQGSRFKSNGYFNSPYKDKNMVIVSLPNDDEVYQSSVNEIFVGIDKLIAVDVASYDLYFRQQAFAIEMPLAYSASHAPDYFRVTPYFINESTGQTTTGQYMDVTQFTMRQWGDYMTWNVYFTSEKCFAIARNEVPDGYKFAGFSYRWFVTGSFVEDTSFYFSWLEYATYEPSNATSAAVNQMSDKLSAELQEMGDKISNSIEEKADEILKGWTPNPVNPDGSDDITEYEQKEQQLIDGSQEGINLGLNTIDGVGDRLFNYRAGFTVVIGLFDLLMGVDWIHTVLTVGLALGIVGFILSIPFLLGRASRKR